jgi:MtrB/PioB family decaheme-associated outer membrane protein
MMTSMTKCRHQKHRYACTIIAIALVHGSALAQETNAATCALCGPASGWELDIKAGPGYVFGDNFRFGDYTGLEEKGLYLFGDVFARYWGEDAEFMRIDSYRLGQDSRALFIEGGKQGVYKVRASYQGIPRKIFDTTSTPYGGNDTLNLPTNWVRAPTTQGMTELGNSLQRIKIGRDWGVYNFGIGYTPTSRWAFDLNYRRQERDGNTISSGSFFIDAAMFASPVEDVTDEMDITAAYYGDTWQVSTSYRGSVYNNENSSLDWDNAYTAPPGADTGQMALAPDNESHQVTLAGSAFLPARTTLNGQISLGRMTQDDGFLPYTSNALLATSPLPRNSANAKVDTTNINLRAVSSPLQKLTLQAEFRYDERDNKTPESAYNYVVTDLFNSAISARNIAYDYRRLDFRLRGEYRLPARTRLSVGYDFKRDERTRQERDETTNDRVWAKIRANAFEYANLDFEVYAESRDGSSYNPIANIPNPQNPLMRKYNMADRERDGYKFYVSSYAGERLDLGVELEYNKDDYQDSDIGLQQSTYSRYGIDASYLFPKGVSFYAATYKEDISARQANSQSFSNPDWEATTDDTFFTGTTGIRFPDILGRMAASLDYSYARSIGETKNDTSGLTSEFPELRSKLQQLKLGLEYQYNDLTSLNFYYMYELFKTDDWALEGVEAATVPNLLSLGADPYNYTAHVFFVGVRYVFDSRGQAGPRTGATLPPY